MVDVKISKADELYIRIDADKGIMYEMQDHFSYYAEGYKYMAKFKSGVWDGKIRLLNMQTRKLYSGLLGDVIKFCKRYDYTYEVSDELKPVDFLADIKEFVKKMPELSRLTPHDHQMEAFIGAIVENKSLILSPTASGKSLIIYLIVRFMLEHTDDDILLVVPTTNLVEQMVGDFQDYDPEKQIEAECHKIYSGKDKLAETRVTVTTWQSIFKLPAEWFARYGTVIVDEAHQADASSITGIVEKLPHAKFRVGLTGTLDGTKTHELFMRGLFGKIIRATTTRKLMDEGKLADLEIVMLRLKYKKEECKSVKSLDYENEIQYIVQHENRNKMLVNLALKQTQNTLLLFNFVEGHGEKLFAAATEKAEQFGRMIFLIHGNTPVPERERIRALLETRNDITVFASFGTFSMGNNMKNLHVVIFAHPYKSRTRNLQAIGRGLRTNAGKTKATLVDICDDLTYNNKHNAAYDHSIARLKIYESEQFKYKIHEIEI